MKAIVLGILLSFPCPVIGWAQQTDSTATPPPPPVPVEPAGPSKVFYGGTLGVSFGSYFRLSIQPMVGYNITPKIAAGVKGIYEYVKDTRYATEYTWHNFGASAFTRYYLVPQLYAHAEFAYMSYDSPIDRVGVPFLLLGGGYVQRLSANAGVYVEVLFDVLQDKNSPYEDWTPFISVGAAVGI